MNLYNIYLMATQDRREDLIKELITIIAYRAGKLFSLSSMW